MHLSLLTFRKRLINPALVSTAVVLLTPHLAHSQDVSAEPRYGTAHLDSGFTPDPYTRDVVAGGEDDASHLGADCTGLISNVQPDLDLNYVAGDYPLGIFVSGSVDTTLVINNPAGEWWCNDDFDADSAGNPGLVFTDPQSGNYNIWVGAYDTSANNETVVLQITENSAPPQSWVSSNPEGSTGSSTESSTERSRTERGQLQSGDTTLDSGEYTDTYDFEGQAGELASIDLQSQEFDTYLMLIAPDGEHFSNDDFEASQNHSLLTMTLPQSGTYQVVVTSYQAGESGSYTLALNTDTPTMASGLAESGVLEEADSTLDSGEYYDSYEISGTPGQRVNVSLSSDAFDPYLIVRTPAGEAFQNDDDATSSNSFVEFTIAESGTHRVLVTSFAPGESGSYALNVTYPDAGISQMAESDEITELAIGESLAGSLQDSDAQLENGEYRDLYSFMGTSGQVMRIELNSDQFDTYLAIVTPSGEDIQNDDFNGSSEVSVIEIPLQESGRYRILATSYTSGERGAYQLSLTTGSAPASEPAQSGGKVYGIFAGIADYPDEGNDLAFTDEDAFRIRDALIEGAGMNPADAITLTDAQATRENLSGAIMELASKMQPEDTFVFFYSGHGSQQVNPNGFEAADPDGKDETIELYDGALTDNDFNELLSTVASSRMLIVLDSCFSGGFSKDVISQPGRMGLFSSEEDVTSQVASKFRAGGYLSVFFEEAIQGGYADLDEDSVLTAIEISQYLHERFRNDVKSFGEDQYVRTSGSQMGYQHLVVDRGSIGPYDALFTR